MGFYSNVIFPHVLDWAMRDPQMAEQRPLVLEKAQGDIFEVGFGTGLNLRYYPDTVEKITTADPHPTMGKIAQRRVDASSIDVDHHVIGGESLPFEDESFDTIVCTWTLCSIPDIEAALGQFHRILRKDGKLLFIEHGLSDNPKVQQWQNRINPVWKIIGDGCNLNRNHRELIQDHQFTFDEIDTFSFAKGLRPATFMYRGVAQKA